MSDPKIWEYNRESETGRMTEMNNVRLGMSKHIEEGSQDRYQHW